MSERFGTGLTSLWQHQPGRSKQCISSPSPKVDSLPCDKLHRLQPSELIIPVSASRRRRVSLGKPRGKVPAPGKPTLLDLPEEAWLRVFSYLTVPDRIRAGLVCRRLKEMARKSWKGLTKLSYEDVRNVSLTSMKLSGDFLDMVLRQCGPSLQSLELQELPLRRFTHRFFHIIGNCGGWLQQLDLSHNGMLRNRELSLMVNSLPQLRMLCVHSCPAVGEDGLRVALVTLQSLEVLDIGNNEQLTGVFLSHAPRSLREVHAVGSTHLTDTSVCLLAERCPALETLDVTRTTCLTRHTLARLSQTCKRLRTVRGMNHADFTWDETTLLRMCGLPYLQELIVVNHTSDGRTVMTDGIFCELSRHCRYLCDVMLHKCDGLTTAALQQLTPWRHLRSFHIGFSLVGDAWLAQFVRLHSPQLQSLTVEYCPRVTDRGMRSIAATCSNLAQVTRLRSPPPPPTLNVTEEEEEE